MEKELKLTKTKVRKAVEKILHDNYSSGDIADVKLPNDSSPCLNITLLGELFLDKINDIAQAFGDERAMITSDEYNTLTMTMIPTKDPTAENEEEDQAPHIKLRHKDQFPDVQEDIIPDTEVKVSNTEMRAQILMWMDEAERIPLYYEWCYDGIHVEVSETAETKMRYVLQNGAGLGKDGRKYTIEKPGNLFPMGSSICVMAIPEGEEHSEAYNLGFFI